jgi:hypothetical protein
MGGGRVCHRPVDTVSAMTDRGRDDAGGDSTDLRGAPAPKQMRPPVDVVISRLGSADTPGRLRVAFDMLGLTVSGRPVAIVSRDGEGSLVFVDAADSGVSWTVSTGHREYGRAVAAGLVAMGELDGVVVRASVPDAAGPVSSN